MRFFHMRLNDPPAPAHWSVEPTLRHPWLTTTMLSTIHAKHPRFFPPLSCRQFRARDVAAGGASIAQGRERLPQPCRLQLLLG